MSRWRPKLDETSNSTAPSRQNTTPAAIGPKRIEENLKRVLHEAWLAGFTTKSDFAREYATFVAMAASSGLITTQIMPQVFGNSWTITSKGLVVLEDEYGVNTQEDDE